MEMTGFLDGINDSLVEANPIDTMEEDTKVNLVFDKEKLYKNMVDAKADWLYELPQWKEIFDDEKRRALFLEQKKSGTVHAVSYTHLKERRKSAGDGCHLRPVGDRRQRGLSVHRAGRKLFLPRGQPPGVQMCIRDRDING